MVFNFYRNKMTLSGGFGGTHTLKEGIKTLAYLSNVFSRYASDDGLNSTNNTKLRTHRCGLHK